MNDFTTSFAPGGSTREAVTISWLKPFGLVGLSLYNFAMRLLTLGVYHFWGKTEVRRRIWSAIRLNGEPLEYTGTGGELFKGFLVIFGAILLPVSLVTFGAVLLFGPGSAALGAFQLVLYAGFLLLTGIAIYRAQRFRLSRTRWRGIRAGLEGSSWHYGWTYFWTLLTLPLTLGWSAPWRSTKLQRIMTSDMRFGTERFSFSATSAPLYKAFAVYWVLLAAGVTALLVGVFAYYHSGGADLMDEGAPAELATGQITKLVAVFYGGLFLAGLLFVILSAWYRAATMRHFARHTHLGGIGFESRVTAGGLLWVGITNYLILMLGMLVATAAFGALLLAILPMAALYDPAAAQMEEPNAAASLASTLFILVVLLSLGMLLPVTQGRMTGYLVRNLQLSGGLDMHAIAAGVDPASTRGEGLAQAFDIDAL